MHQKPNDSAPMSDKSFSRTMTLSILSIVACMVVLVSMTWAWFGDTVSTPGNTIRAGYYHVRVAVTSAQTVTASAAAAQTAAATAESSPAETNAVGLATAAAEPALTVDAAIPAVSQDAAGKSVFSAEAAVTYTVALTAEGTTTEKSGYGYCLIGIKQSTDTQETYYVTEKIPCGTTIHITVTLADGGTVSFYPHWGKYVSGSYEKVSNSESITAATNRPVATFSAIPAQTNAVGITVTAAPPVTAAPSPAETNAAGIANEP